MEPETNSPHAVIYGAPGSGKNINFSVLMNRPGTLDSFHSVVIDPKGDFLYREWDEESILTREYEEFMKIVNEL